MFNNYDVNFIQDKNNNLFSIIIKSNLTKVILNNKNKNNNIEISVDGNLPVNISNGEEIKLKKGDLYNLTIYMNGKEIDSHQVDLTDYNSDQYILNFNGVPYIKIIIFLIGLIALISIIIYIKKYKYRKLKNNNFEKKQIIKDLSIIKNLVDCNKVTKVYSKQSNEIINLNGNIININDILPYNEYERILQINIIDELKKFRNKTKNNLRLAKHYISLSSIYIDIDSNKYLKIRNLNDILIEIDMLLDDIQEEIYNLDKSIIGIKEESNNRKITEIKKIVDKARNIYIELEKCYLKLDNIKEDQYYIERDIKQLSKSSYEIKSDYSYDIEKKSYMDIVDNNAKVLAKVMEYIIIQGNQIQNSFSFIKSELSSMNDSLDKLYNNMDKDIKKIFESIDDNKENMYIAMKRFDINISKNLNSNIKSINSQIEKIKYEIKENKNNTNLQNSVKILTEELNKAIDIKSKSTEELMEKIVEKSLKSKKYSLKSELCSKYKNILDNRSWGYLSTAEYLYEDNRNIKLDDYSFIYIMYSKLLEAELGKCIKYSKPKGLGSIIKYLSKDDMWLKFEKEFNQNEIRDLRNGSAHPGEVVSIDDVKIIRDFLIDKSFNDNKICWLDFIINNHKYK